METLETLAYVLLAINLSALIGYHLARNEHERKVAIWVREHSLDEGGAQ